MTDTRQCRILVVDDLAENREILVDLLGSEGYILDTAVDGAEAVEKALPSPPDLILMHASMPPLTDLEASPPFKAAGRTPPGSVVPVPGPVAGESRAPGIPAPAA